MPAIVGAFCAHRGYSSLVEQQPDQAVGRGFESRYPTRCAKLSHRVNQASLRPPSVSDARQRLSSSALLLKLRSCRMALLCRARSSAALRKARRGAAGRSLGDSSHQFAIIKEVNVMFRRVLVGDNERVLLIRKSRFARYPRARRVLDFTLGRGIELERHNIKDSGVRRRVGGLHRESAARAGRALLHRCRDPRLAGGSGVPGWPPRARDRARQAACCTGAGRWMSRSN